MKNFDQLYFPTFFPMFNFKMNLLHLISESFSLKLFCQIWRSNQVRPSSQSQKNRLDRITVFNWTITEAKNGLFRICTTCTHNRNKREEFYKLVAQKIYFQGLRCMLKQALSKLWKAQVFIYQCQVALCNLTFFPYQQMIVTTGFEFLWLHTYSEHLLQKNIKELEIKYLVLVSRRQLKEGILIDLKVSPTIRLAGWVFHSLIKIWD